MDLATDDFKPLMGTDDIALDVVVLHLLKNRQHWLHC
jgi:hypothetical protein